MDIGTWLHGLGLQQYEPAFRVNDIDSGTLFDLTEADLERLGVVSVGHRKKLLKAIASLQALAPDAAWSGTQAKPKPPAERRQLTVLFSDLVGSTALSTRLDPEDLREVISSYQRCVAETVTRFEGFVAKYMGDGVLVYFGWPKAHENDAERGVRAGLAVIDAVAASVRAPAGGNLAARVGIATGLVVVGDLVGEGASQEQAVIGETPNLAARLQTAAEPGRVVISEMTRNLIGELFILAELQGLNFKGFAQPIRAWSVIREGKADSRFEALRGLKLTRLIGREREQQTFRDCWARARTGDGQVVLLSGEAGIGKSRLALAFRTHLQSDEHTSLHFQGSPHHTTSAFFPFIDHLARTAGFERHDEPTVKLAKLEIVLRRATADVTNALPMIAGLLGLPTDQRYLDLSPIEKRLGIFHAVISEISGLATQRPLLVIVEDVHWFDPTSIELIEMLLERIKTLPILLLITFRPDFASNWTSMPHVTSLVLGRIARDQGTALIDQLTGGAPLPPEVRIEILGKTDGIPLFLEELTKTVLESGVLRKIGNRYELSDPLAPIVIPSTLQESLLARLDRLGSSKEVAQVAAVIGLEFKLELLASIAGFNEESLALALRQLIGAELMMPQPTQNATFAFKHALVRDAAYQSLLKQRRQQLHGSIVSALESRFPELAEAQPELLANHLTEAGQVERATEYWLLAGQQATARSANFEAIAHLRKGLAVLETLPETPLRDRREFELQSSLGSPLIATRGFSSPEVSRAYDRALELYGSVQQPAKLLPVLNGQWTYYAVRAEHQRAMGLAEQFLDLAKSHGDEGPIGVAHQTMGFSLFETGYLAKAQTHYELALARYDPVRHRSMMIDYAQDQKTMILTFYGVVLWLLGYPDQAKQARDEGLVWAREINHPHTLGFTLGTGAFLDLARREPEIARVHSAEVISLSAEKTMPLWNAVGQIVEGWSQVMDESSHAGLNRMKMGIADFRATGAGVQCPFYLAALGEANAKLNDPAAMADPLEEALALVELTGEQWWLADLHRLKGEMLLRLSSDNELEAESHFRRAMEIARDQIAKSLELRAAISVARLWAGRRQRERAYDLLAPIYNWFTEGFDTPDLTEAKFLLDTLR